MGVRLLRIAVGPPSIADVPIRVSLPAVTTQLYWFALDWLLIPLGNEALPKALG
jgi:hypothetical protein